MHSRYCIENSGWFNEVKSPISWGMQLLRWNNCGAVTKVKKIDTFKLLAKSSVAEKYIHTVYW